MQNFFLDLKNSAYGPQYYQDLLAKPFSYSLKYFVLFGVLVALLAGAVFAAVYLPGVKTAVNQVAVQLLEFYPAELQIVVVDEKVSTNVNEPYFIKAPTGFSTDETRIENLVAIDTQTPFSIEKFQEYKSLVWLTKDALAFVDEDSGSLSGFRYVPLRGVPDFVLNKEKAQNFWSGFQPILEKWLNWIAVFVVLAVIFWLGWLMLYLLLFALIVKLIGCARLDYKKAYQLGLHLFTPAILLVLVLKTVGIAMPLLFTVAAVVFGLINLKFGKTGVEPTTTN